MVRFEYCLACKYVLIKRTKSHFMFYKLCENVSAIQVLALRAIAFKVFEILAFIRTNRQTDMARSTQLWDYVYIIRSETLQRNMDINILSDESSKPFFSTSYGYNNIYKKGLLFYKKTLWWDIDGYSSYLKNWNGYQN